MHTPHKPDSGLTVTFSGTGPSLGIPVINCACSVCKSTDYRDKRTRSSIFIEKHDTKIVVDCSPDFRQQALREKICQLDALLITHRHRDHIGGFYDLIKIFATPDLKIFAGENILQSLKKNHPKHLSGSNSKNVVFAALDENPFQIGSMDVKPVPCFHGKLPVWGFVIDKKIGYFTDVNFIPESQWHWLIGLDVLILSALQQQTHDSHLSVSQAVEWIQKLNPKKAFITHLSHDAGTHVQLEQQLPFPVFAAFDGLKINID